MPDIQFTITIVHVLIMFFLGVALGSFLNVVVLRHYSGERLSGRSHCMHCKKTLSWYELFPMLSYIFQLGRCRSCKHFLSPQYPLVELSMGILATMTLTHVLGPVGGIVSVNVFTIAELVLHFAIWFLFLAITAYDIKTKLIPNIFSYTLAALALVLLFVESEFTQIPTFWVLASGPILFFPFHFLWAVSGGKWIGLGDAKLAIGIGWFLGLSLGGTAVLLAFWIGAFVSVGIIVFQKMLKYTVKLTTGEELTLKSEVPFGPFLVLGTLIVYITQMNLFSNIMYLF